MINDEQKKKVSVFLVSNGNRPQRNESISMKLSIIKPPAR
jgi:hypothetical protein